MKFATKLSDAAETIGAVNTLIPIEGGYFGDNTDWVGISNSFIRAGVPPKLSSNGLVVGAGGTSRAAIYALHQMGCAKIYLVNRTAAKLEELVKSFLKTIILRLSKPNNKPIKQVKSCWQCLVFLLINH